MRFYNAVDQPKDREYQGFSNAGEVSRSSLASENLRFASFLPDALPWEPSIDGSHLRNRPSEHTVHLVVVGTRDAQKERSETVVTALQNRLLHYGPEIPGL